MDNELKWLNEDHPCTGCGGLVPRGLVRVLDPRDPVQVEVEGWCDLCFQAWIVNWRRQVWAKYGDTASE